MPVVSFRSVYLFEKVTLSRGHCLRVTVMIRLSFEDSLQVKLSMEDSLEGRFSFEDYLEEGEGVLNRLD